jgi:hypothetical protein
MKRILPNELLSGLEKMASSLTSPFKKTLLGLTENIFARLRNSEYFVFIDFKREELAGTKLHRGSLFSHQELAIAAFLNVDAVIAFQEKGVKADDGMLRFLQANARPFIDRDNLPSFVADFVRERHWDPVWKNELELEREPEESSNAMSFIRPGLNMNARYFHIKVYNRHREKLATNCFVYLEKIIRLPDTEIQLKTVEFKWAGVIIPGVAIAPGSKREFDAFHILHERPTNIQFSTFSDSPDYNLMLPDEAADYELSYVVRSENFPPARGVFRLRLNAQLNDTTFL